MYPNPNLFTNLSLTVNWCWCTRGWPRLKVCLRHSLFHIPTPIHIPTPHINKTNKESLYIVKLQMDLMCLNCLWILESNFHDITDQCDCKSISIFSNAHKQHLTAPFSTALFSSDTRNKMMGATVEISYVFSPFKSLPVPLEELTPLLPIVVRKLYGVAMLSLESNICLLSVRLCCWINLLTSRSAFTLDLVFISNHTEEKRTYISLSLVININAPSLCSHFLVFI